MRRVPILAVLGGGLALRLVLAFVIYPGQGFAGDLRFFAGWAEALAAGGPAAFYASQPSANYPPAYMYVLWALGSAAHGQALVALLKLPAVLADIGVAALLYRAAGRWLGERAGVVAAALYLFIPVIWYDSALWGQVDAVVALAMVAALVLLIEGRSEAAAGAAVLALLIKPQAVVCLVVVAPVLLRRHLLARREPLRLATSALAALAVAGIVLAPFDIERFAPAPVAAVPLVGDLAGLVGLIRSAGDQYAVLTANAYNAWALVGPRPLVDAIGGGASAWTPDSLPVLADLPAVALGGMLLAAVWLLVAGGLLRRDGALPILLGFTLAAFAFYALPTRVHERYLFPVFASGAVLASAALVRSAWFIVVGLLNTVNLHAVLAAPFGPGLRGAGGPRGAFGRGFGAIAVSGIDLPLGEVARSPLLATVAALGQTAALVALLAAWLLVLAPRPAPGRQVTLDRA